MKRFFSIIILCIVIYSCTPGIPKKLIQPDQMEKILFDIHVVDGYISTVANRDTAKIVASSYYRGVYKKFGIDSAIYTTSMNYYYSHPELLDKIYEKVAKTFEIEKIKNDKVMAKELLDSQPNKEIPKYLQISAQPDINWSKPKIEANPFDIALLHF